MSRTGLQEPDPYLGGGFMGMSLEPHGGPVYTLPISNKPAVLDFYQLTVRRAISLLDLTVLVLTSGAKHHPCAVFGLVALSMTRPHFLLFRR